MSARNPFTILIAAASVRLECNYTCVDFVKWRINCMRANAIVSARALGESCRGSWEANNLLPAACNKRFTLSFSTMANGLLIHLSSLSAAARPVFSFLCRPPSGELIVCVKTHYSTPVSKKSLFSSREQRLLMFRLGDTCNSRQHITFNGNNKWIATTYHTSKLLR